MGSGRTLKAYSLAEEGGVASKGDGLLYYGAYVSVVVCKALGNIGVKG